jgi:hypothetical protein
MGFLDVLSAITGGSRALGTGMQQNRANQNDFADSRGRTLANIFGTQTGAQTGIYGSQANQQTGQYNTQQDAVMQALLGSSGEATRNAQIDLDRKKFALDAPATRATQAARGSLLQSLRPATVSGGSPLLQANTPTISGGFNDPLGPGAREAGRLLESGALAGLKSGDVFDPLQKTDFQGGVLKPPGILAAPTPIPAPNLPGYQGPGGLESLLGALGLAKPVIDDILKRRRAVPGSGVGDTFGLSPYTFGQDIDTRPPVPPPGLTGETGARMLPPNPGDPSNPDWQGPPNPDWWEPPPDWQGPIQTGGFGGTGPGGVNWEDFDWEW